MKKPTVFSGIAFAIVATVFSVPIWWGLKMALPFFLAFRLVTLTAYLGYCGYLLRTAKSRIGGLSLAVANLVIAVVLSWLPVSNYSIVGVLVVLVSVNRSLLFHRSLLALAGDGFLSMLGLLLAGYLFGISGNLPAALWGFSLVQAVFVLVPEVGSFSNRAETSEIDPFLHGQRQAEAVLERIITRV